MAEGRMLRKKASRDERLAQLSDQSALLYVLAIPHLDVEGRMIGLPVSVRGLVVPAFAKARPGAWTDEHVAAYIFEWTSTVAPDGCIDPLVLWYAVAGESVLAFRGFAKNQTLRRDRESPSRLPAPPPELLEQPALASAGMAHLANSGSEQEVEVEVALPTGFSFARGREPVERKSLQISQEIETSLDSAALRTPAVRGFGTGAAGESLLPTDEDLVRVVADLAGADDGTLHQLKVWRRRGCRERQFAVARESLVNRRRSGRKLGSEARYFCSELARQLKEREETAA